MLGIHTIKASVNCFAHSLFTAAKSVNMRLNSKYVPEGGDLTEYTYVQWPRQSVNMTWLSKQTATLSHDWKPYSSI